MCYFACFHGTFRRRANQALTTPRKNYSALAVSQAEGINQASA
jgi:hypothetical protein